MIFALCFLSGVLIGCYFGRWYGRRSSEADEKIGQYTILLHTTWTGTMRDTGEPFRRIGYTVRRPDGHSCADGSLGVPGELASELGSLLDLYVFNDPRRKP